jgi:transcriptional regulator with PAS, ATPase and Fis domain
MNFTKAIANKVDEFTIHSSLNKEINRRISKITRERVRRLWIKKIIIIIDEISMINAKMLIKIDNNCVIVKTRKRDTNNLFENIFIVILMKDFFQFISMIEKSLWQTYTNFIEKQSRDILLWNKFDNVIILNEQMRQAQDVKYRNMMHRARHANLNSNDITILNQKMISSFKSSNLDNVIVIVKRNSICHIINRIQMKSLFLKNNQSIIMFFARHDRFSQEIKIDELLNNFDHVEMFSSKLFFYIKNASVILLSNLNFVFRLMNDNRRYMNNVVVDSECKNFSSVYDILY